MVTAARTRWREALRSCRLRVVDQVTFDLLEDQKYKDEKDCLFRAHHEDQETAKYAADESSKDWDQGCEGYDDSNQQCIRHFQYT